MFFSALIKGKITLSKYICYLKLLIKIMFLFICKSIVLIGTASKQFDDDFWWAIHLGLLNTASMMFKFSAKFGALEFWVEFGFSWKCNLDLFSYLIHGLTMTNIKMPNWLMPKLELTWMLFSSGQNTNVFIFDVHWQKKVQRKDCWGKILLRNFPFFVMPLYHASSDCCKRL